MSQPESADNKTTLQVERWVDEYGDYLFRYAISRLHDESTAEELVQDTFLAGIKAQESFRGDSAERTWLVSILKHKIIDHIRKLARRRDAGERDLPDDNFDKNFMAFELWSPELSPRRWDASPGEVFQQKEFFEALSSCMSKLPERLNQVFTLRELEELPTEEICKIVDITPSNLWVMLHRARHRLRDCLDKNWFDNKEQNK